MPQEEKPVGSAATPEERRAAIAAGDDVFDESTTDNTAADNASPEDLEAARVAEEELNKVKTEGGADDVPDASQNTALADALSKLADRLPAVKPTEDKPKELTPEQLDELMNKYQISDELLTKLDNPETRKEALQEIVGGSAKQGATLATILMSDEMKKLRDSVAPLLHAETQRNLEAHRKQFYDEYPSLNDEAFTPIIEIAAEQLKTEGKVPKTTTEARQLLAERAGSLIKKVNPAFDVKAKSTQQKPKTTTTTIPKQATAPAKGGGGGANGATKTAAPAERNRSKGVEVFD